jgi:Flp pilus assembly pilin Flp
MRTSRVVTFLRAVTRDTAGQDLIEYGLLLGIASAATIFALGSISNKVVDIYGDTVTEIAAAGGGGVGDPAGGDAGGGGTPGGGTPGGGTPGGGTPGGGRGGGKP